MDKSAHKLISIIILTWKRTALLRQCLKSIAVSRQMPPCEIIVVVNGKDEQTSTFLKDKADIRSLILEKRIGRGAARNRAVKEVSGDIVYFVDDDVIMPPTTIHCLWQKWQQYPDVAAIGGPNIGMPNENIMQACCSRVLGSRLGTGFFVNRYRRFKNDFLATDHDLSLCNLSIKRDIFHTYSFPKDVVSNEENILLQTLETKGQVFLYTPDVYVHHHRGDSIKSVYLKCKSYGEGRADNIFINAKGAFVYGFFVALAMTYLFLLLLHLQDWMYRIPLISYLTLCLLVSGIQSISMKGKNKVKVVCMLCGMYFLIHGSYGLGIMKGIIRNLRKI